MVGVAVWRSLACQRHALAGGMPLPYFHGPFSQRSSFVQDMNRFVSGIVKVSFEGPDLSDESLYRLLRVRSIIVPVTSGYQALTSSMRSRMVEL